MWTHQFANEPTEPSEPTVIKQIEFDGVNGSLCEPTALNAGKRNSLQNSRSSPEWTGGRVARSEKGRFLPHPLGTKTARMLKAEQRLKSETGLETTLYEDYCECYVRKGYSQKAIAARWGVPRKTIFFSRGRSPSWVQRLGLPVRSEDDASFATTQSSGNVPDSSRRIRSAAEVPSATAPNKTDPKSETRKRQILTAVREAFEATMGDHSDNWKAITNAWQGKCLSLGRNRSIQNEVVVSAHLGQRIDLVDWEEGCAYELNVSGKHSADEFYKDIFKVLAHNEAQPETRLGKLVFITRRSSRKSLGISMPRAIVDLVSRKMGLQVEIEYVSLARPVQKGVNEPDDLRSGNAGQ